MWRPLISLIAELTMKVVAYLVLYFLYFCGRKESDTPHVWGASSLPWDPQTSGPQLDPLGFLSGLMKEYMFVYSYHTVHAPSIKTL